MLAREWRKMKRRDNRKNKNGNGSGQLPRSLSENALFPQLFVILKK
jgi:hypothetical protein